MGWDGMVGSEIGREINNNVGKSQIADDIIRNTSS
jgi:hypothetical protein